MIGVFDSGYGGLSVFKEMVKSFPQYSFIYLGDNARAPYGSRSKDIVTEYTKESLEWLFKEGSKIVVLACNTASGEALESISNSEFLTKQFSDKIVLGVIDPVTDFLSEFVSKDEIIGVIGTTSTIRSHKYAKSLNDIGFSNVVERATPLLAPLVETGKVEGPMAEHIIADALSPFTRDGVSNVILGCTHYYFLRETIEKLYPHLKLFDASEAFPRFFKKFLLNRPLIEEKIGRGDIPRFYTTDEEDDFARFVEKTLGLSIYPKKIKLA